MGLIGSAIATCISRILQLVILWTIILWKGLHKGTCDVIHKEAFTLKAVLEYLKIGLPSGLWFFLDSMGWNVVTILVGSVLKSQYSVAAHMIAYNIIIFAFIPTLAYSAAVSTRVGNLIGEKRPVMAKYASTISVIFCTSVTIVQAIIIVLCAKWLIKIWNDTDEIVFNIALNLYFFSAGITLLDAFMAVISSVLRAIGRQTICAIASIGYVAIGVPLGLVLVKFTNLDVYGFWCSLLISLILMSIVLLFYFQRIDWEGEVIRASDRMNQSDTNKSTEKNQTNNEELGYLVGDNAAESFSITIESESNSK